uniref:PBPe domain-containing protein n=1 Tax=Strongyloides venezuelensis TaxID=75913 RepID=A0A0K0F711_STRVS
MKLIFIFLFLLVALLRGRSLSSNTKEDFNLALEVTTKIIIYGMVYYIDKNLISTSNDINVKDLNITNPYKDMEITDIIWLVYPINIFINKTNNLKKREINKQWNILNKKISNSSITVYNRTNEKILHIKNYTYSDWDGFVLIGLFQNSNYISLLEVTVLELKKYVDNEDLFNKNFIKLLKEWYIAGKLDFVVVVGNEKSTKILKENLKIKLIENSTMTSTEAPKTLTTTTEFKKLKNDYDKEVSINPFDNVEIGGVVILFICLSGLMSLFLLNEYQYRKNKNEIRVLRNEQENGAKNEILNNRVLKS